MRQAIRHISRLRDLLGFYYKPELLNGCAYATPLFKQVFGLKYDQQCFMTKGRGADGTLTPVDRTCNCMLVNDLSMMVMELKGQAISFVASH